MAQQPEPTIGKKTLFLLNGGFRLLWCPYRPGLPKINQQKAAIKLSEGTSDSTSSSPENGDLDFANWLSKCDRKLVVMTLTFAVSFCCKLQILWRGSSALLVLVISSTEPSGLNPGDTLCHRRRVGKKGRLKRKHRGQKNIKINKHQDNKKQENT